MATPCIFTIRDIAEVIRARQSNEFDARFAVCGDTGDGKSTLVGKICYRLGKFDPWKHQVYSQKAIIQLLKTERRGICWDDEAINSGYKRNWQDQGQQKLIKILTNYRDSGNVYASAVPNFFSLDKDLRDLFFMMFHVVERGIAVVHLPLKGTLYAQDKWDAKNNAKIEQKWNEKRKRNPNFRPPYHKLSTFAGYLYFGKLTKKQEALYKEVKKIKRAEEYADEEKPKEDSFYEKAYKLLIEGKLSKDSLLDICQFQDKKYSSVTAQLNTMLTERRFGKTVSQCLKGPETAISNNNKSQIKDIIPTFTQDSI